MPIQKKISEQPCSNGESIRHTVLWEGIRTTHFITPTLLYVFCLVLALSINNKQFIILVTLTPPHISNVFLLPIQKISEQAYSNGEPIRHTVMWEGIRTTHKSRPHLCPHGHDDHVGWVWR